MTEPHLIDIGNFGWFMAMYVFAPFCPKIVRNCNKNRSILAVLPMKRRGDPNGIRTRVTAVKGRCPRPLDDRVTEAAQYSIR
jgi:hypothetical protein